MTVESNQWSVIRTLSVAFRHSISSVTIKTCTRVWPWGVGTFSSRMTLVSGPTCTLIYVFKIKYTTNIITESLMYIIHEYFEYKLDQSMIFVILFPNGCSIWCSKLPFIETRKCSSFSSGLYSFSPLNKGKAYHDSTIHFRSNLLDTCRCRSQMCLYKKHLCHRSCVHQRNIRPHLHKYKNKFRYCCWLNVKGKWIWWFLTLTFEAVTSEPGSARTAIGPLVVGTGSMRRTFMCATSTLVYVLRPEEEQKYTQIGSIPLKP